MNRPYIPGTLAELYEIRAAKDRRNLRLKRTAAVLIYLGLCAVDVYLWWPE